MEGRPELIGCAIQHRFAAIQQLSIFLRINILFIQSLMKGLG